MNLLELAELLKENANSKIDFFVWGLIEANKNLIIKGEKLLAEVIELRATVDTLKEVIKSLTHQHKYKGE